MHLELFLKAIIIPLKFSIGLAQNGERIKSEKEKRDRETKEN